jgi:hypothetical protein
MITANDRFECIGDLYYRRFGRLRPGKSEAPETYRDSKDDENRTQFDQWFAVKSFMDAIDRIIELEAEVKRLGYLLEAAEQQNEAFRSQS